MSQKKIFIALGIVWVVILGGFIGYKEFTMRTGQEVTLKTVPVDPRDFFRGDYVTLRYDISSFNLSTTTTAASIGVNDTVYAEIENTESGFWKITNISKVPSQGRLSIKGVVKSAYGTTVNIEYGIESYFVPANKGYALQQKMGHGASAVVAVDALGNAVIKKILIDGNEIDFSKIEAKN